MPKIVHPEFCYMDEWIADPHPKLSSTITCIQVSTNFSKYERHEKHFPTWTILYDVHNVSTIHFHGKPWVKLDVQYQWLLTRFKKYRLDIWIPIWQANEVTTLLHVFKNHMLVKEKERTMNVSSSGSRGDKCKS